jgi:hypothetical protein
MRVCIVCGEKYAGKTSQLCSPQCEERDDEIRAAMSAVKRVNPADKDQNQNEKTS